jgi:hypothetical protein
VAPPGAIRRNPGAVLLRCAHDIRPILEGRDEAPVCRELKLAVTMLPGTDAPQVSTLSSDLFGLLGSLDEFIDPAVFQPTAEMDRLIRNLAADGFIEVHP